ncbi:MAG: TfoX/Sxy family protein [Anaerolineae bacterium]
MRKAKAEGRIMNIGPKTTVWLNEIGIYTLKDLEAIGAVEAYRRLKASRPQEVTLNALWGLQGAILNLHWNALPPDMKAELKAQVEE